MPTDPMVLLSIFDGIATVVLNRPEKHNAMDGLVVDEMINTLQHLANDKTIHVLLLKANGENFCAGGDLQWMQKMAASSLQENRQDATRLALLMSLIHSFPKPVIVLVHGMTLGGGLGLIAAGDIVIAANNASFAFFEVKMGIS